MTTYQIKCIVKWPSGEIERKFGNVHEFMAPAMFEQHAFEEHYTSLGATVESEILIGDRAKAFEIDPLEIDRLMKIDRRIPQHAQSN